MDAEDNKHTECDAFTYQHKDVCHCFSHCARGSMRAEFYALFYQYTNDLCAGPDRHLTSRRDNYTRRGTHHYQREETSHAHHYWPWDSKHVESLALLYQYGDVLYTEDTKQAECDDHFYQYAVRASLFSLRYMYADEYYTAESDALRPVLLCARCFAPCYQYAAGPYTEGDAGQHAGRVRRLLLPVRRVRRIPRPPLQLR